MWRCLRICCCDDDAREEHSPLMMNAATSSTVVKKSRLRLPNVPASESRRTSPPFPSYFRISERLAISTCIMDLFEVKRCLRSGIDVNTPLDIVNGNPSALEHVAMSWINQADIPQDGVFEHDSGLLFIRKAVTETDCVTIAKCLLSAGARKSQSLWSIAQNGTLLNPGAKPALLQLLRSFPTRQDLRELTNVDVEQDSPDYLVNEKQIQHLTEKLNQQLYTRFQQQAHTSTRIHGSNSRSSSPSLHSHHAPSSLAPPTLSLSGHSHTMTPSPPAPLSNSLSAQSFVSKYLADIPTNNSQFSLSSSLATTSTTFSPSTVSSLFMGVTLELPSFPELEANVIHPPIPSNWRMSEQLAVAAKLFDIKTIKTFLIHGGNGNAQVEANGSPPLLDFVISHFNTSTTPQVMHVQRGAVYSRLASQEDCLAVISCLLNGGANIQDSTWKLARNCGVLQKAQDKKRLLSLLESWASISSSSSSAPSSPRYH